MSQQRKVLISEKEQPAKLYNTVLGYVLWDLLMGLLIYLSITTTWNFNVKFLAGLMIAGLLVATYLFITYYKERTAYLAWKEKFFDRGHVVEGVIKGIEEKEYTRYYGKTSTNKDIRSTYYKLYRVVATYPGKDGKIIETESDFYRYDLESYIKENRCDIWVLPDSDETLITNIR